MGLIGGLRAGAVSCAAVLGAAAVPAGAADDAAAVRASLSAAAAQVTSFALEMQVTGAAGVNGNLVFVRPGRIKSTFNIGQMAVETYQIDGILYVHAPAGGWQKTKTDDLHVARQSINIADALKTATVTVLPDRQEDGETVGAVEIQTALPSAIPGQAPAAQEPVTCTYDKETFRLRVCTSLSMTMTYSKYNDPDNAVELPPEARKATPMTLPPTGGEPAVPSPAPAPSPSGR